MLSFIQNFSLMQKYWTSYLVTYLPIFHVFKVFTQSLRHSTASINGPFSLRIKFRIVKKTPKSITTARKSILNLVKLPIFIGKYWKIWKYTLAKVGNFVATYFFFVSPGKATLTEICGKLQYHPLRYGTWACFFTRNYSNMCKICHFPSAFLRILQYFAIKLGNFINYFSAFRNFLRASFFSEWRGKTVWNFRSVGSAAYSIRRKFAV